MSYDFDNNNNNSRNNTYKYSSYIIVDDSLRPDERLQWENEFLFI